jgi:hypothetical protein
MLPGNSGDRVRELPHARALHKKTPFQTSGKVFKQFCIFCAFSQEVDRNVVAFFCLLKAIGGESAQPIPADLVFPNNPLQSEDKHTQVYVCLEQANKRRP